MEFEAGVRPINIPIFRPSHDRIKHLHSLLAWGRLLFIICYPDSGYSLKLLDKGDKAGFWALRKPSKSISARKGPKECARIGEFHWRKGPFVVVNYTKYDAGQIYMHVRHRIREAVGRPQRAMAIVGS